MKERKAFSLKWQLIALVISCWLIPIAAVAAIFGNLLSRSYETSSRQEAEISVQNAISQLDIRLSAAIDDSKDVSYDGIVRSSWRSFQLDGDEALLYSRVNEYLNQRFSRDEKYRAVFISFWGDVDIESYVIAPGVSAYSTLRSYRDRAEPVILAEMASVDTPIRFFMIDGDLYMARNLLDGKFIPYASVVHLCRREVIFRSFEELPEDLITSVSVDDVLVIPESVPVQESDYHQAVYNSEIGGHAVKVTASFGKFSVWRDVPSLKYGVLAAAVLVVPMLLIVILFFYRNVTRPADVLIRGSEKVRAGERGYQITKLPRSEEFRQMTVRFNEMSAELRNQFDQLLSEQQALQQAKIQALQSQINPHFLNNTLEVINWEARMADDDKVSAMIEALSTMLDAALDRDGRGMIPLRQEIGYVDAYLYIIHERLGDRFHAEKEIEPGMEEIIIPRLILQPIVENAVEHDITPNGGGSIRIRAYREDGRVVLETLHSGTLSEADRRKIGQIIRTAESGGEAKVGLQNVAQRLRLIYGSEGELSLTESDETITIRLRFPEHSGQQAALSES